MKKAICIVIVFLFVHVGRGQMRYSISQEENNIVVALTNASDEVIYINPPYDGSFDAPYYEVQILSKEGEVQKNFSDYLSHRCRFLLAKETRIFTFSLLRFKVNNAHSSRVKIHIEGWKYNPTDKKRETVFEEEYTGVFMIK